MPRTNALAYFGEILVIGRFCNNGWNIFHES